MGSKYTDNIQLKNSDNIKWLDRFYVYNSTTNQIVEGHHMAEQAEKATAILNNKMIVSKSSERYQFVNKNLVEVI